MEPSTLSTMKTVQKQKQKKYQTKLREKEEKIPELREKIIYNMHNII